MEKPFLTKSSVKKYYQGLFAPKHPEKYIGDAKKIVFRSGLEKRFYKFLDENSAILRWGSEEIQIRYASPVDKREHTYFPDVFFEVKDNDGVIKKYIAEIKPLKQTKQPQLKGIKSKRTIVKLTETWYINQAKWSAATKWATKRGCKFLILTEKDIKLNFNG